MSEIIRIKNSSSKRFFQKYPPLQLDELPINYDFKIIDYQKEELDKFHEIFWHRLLKNIYQDPSEIECYFPEKGASEPFTKSTIILRRDHEKQRWMISEADKESAYLKNNVMVPANWKYLIQLPSGGIIELGTKDRNTIFYIGSVADGGQADLFKEECKKFIKRLLDEANKQKKDLFNPKKEFEKEQSIKLYILINTYLSNYISGQFMLKTAKKEECKIANEAIKFDARTEDINDPYKKEYILQHSLALGMYFASSISYFFMALEGFINLLFHAFLKKDLQDKELNIEQRFDLEQKIRLIPSLCKGFKEIHINHKHDIYTKFKKLKKFRNMLFHSKIEDSLKFLCFVEDGFIYNYDVDSGQEQLLSPHKYKLTAKNVIEAKGIVDDIINLFLDLMDDNTKILTEKFIMKLDYIPFYISDNGDLTLGRMQK